MLHRWILSRWLLQLLQQFNIAVWFVRCWTHCFENRKHYCQFWNWECIVMTPCSRFAWNVFLDRWPWLGSSSRKNVFRRTSSTWCLMVPFRGLSKIPFWLDCSLPKTWSTVCWWRLLFTICQTILSDVPLPIVRFWIQFFPYLLRTVFQHFREFCQQFGMLIFWSSLSQAVGKDSALVLFYELKIELHHHSTPSPSRPYHQRYRFCQIWIEPSSFSRVHKVQSC